MGPWRDRTSEAYCSAQRDFDLFTVGHSAERLLISQRGKLLSGNPLTTLCDADGGSTPIAPGGGNRIGYLLVSESLALHGPLSRRRSKSESRLVPV